DLTKFIHNCVDWTLNMVSKIEKQNPNELLKDLLPFVLDEESISLLKIIVKNNVEATTTIDLELFLFEFWEKDGHVCLQIVAANLLGISIHIYEPTYSHDLEVLEIKYNNPATYGMNCGGREKKRQIFIVCYENHFEALQKVIESINL
ncbi:MAG: hypothetical protein WD512_07250, partial [Candidatus Paceibacterota bacterium]